MPSDMLTVIGWDIGGVNIKAARLLWQDREIVKYAKHNDLLLVTQDQKPADLADLTGVKYVLISNTMIAKIADTRIREKYLNIKPR